MRVNRRTGRAWLRVALLGGFLVGGLLGCGQKGALYVPESDGASEASGTRPSEKTSDIEYAEEDDS
jgi:predicted small lipoprotein YifL